MFHNINNKIVEIRDKLFPACNIQIWSELLDPTYLDEFGKFFGIVFEIMFENGVSATVSQEMPEILNGEIDSLCLELTYEEQLEHFIVELTTTWEAHGEVFHAYHCRTIDELISVLETEMKINTNPAAIAS